VKRVILETPFAGDVERNLRYARECMRDCLMHHDEAPFASHLLYPQCLDDEVGFERHLGIIAGQVWGITGDRVVAYTDLGISPGMKASLAMYEEAGLPVEYRKLPGWRRAPGDKGDICETGVGDP